MDFGKVKIDKFSYTCLQEIMRATHKRILDPPVMIRSSKARVNNNIFFCRLAGFFSLIRSKFNRLVFFDGFRFLLALAGSSALNLLSLKIF